MYIIYKDFIPICEKKTLKQCASFLGVTAQNLHALNSAKSPVYKCRGCLIVDPSKVESRAVFKAKKLLYLVEVCPSNVLAEKAVDKGLKIIQHQII